MVSKTLSLTRFDAKFCKKMASSLQSRSRLRSRKSRSDCIKCYRIRFYYKKNFALLLSSSFALRAAVKWKKCMRKRNANKSPFFNRVINFVAFFCVLFLNKQSPSPFHGAIRFETTGSWRNVESLRPQYEITDHEMVKFGWKQKRSMIERNGMPLWESN